MKNKTVLAIIMLCALAGCGDNGANSNNAVLERIDAKLQADAAQAASDKAAREQLYATPAWSPSPRVEHHFDAPPPPAQPTH